MIVIALGGCGEMGRCAVRTALQFPNVDRIVIADRNKSRAVALARECGEKAGAYAVDVSDPSALRKLLKQADVVLNTVGPFYRFGVPILEAAIESRCHYLDINDDWEPTLKMLELNEAAENAGITAVVGIGASPGISNLLAVQAAGELDQIDDLMTGWGLGDDSEDFASPADGEVSAAMVHWMHQCSGMIRVHRNGHLVNTSPLERVEFDYPGIGPGVGWTLGHPEPITLPRRMPGLKTSLNVMVMPDWIIDMVRWASQEIDHGHISVANAAAVLQGLPPVHAGGHKLPNQFAVPYLFRRAWTRVKRLVSPKRRSVQRLPGASAIPELFALARGRKNGKEHCVGATIASTPAGGMGGVTGVPLAVGLKLLVEGRIAARGVHAPEACIDPAVFFDALAPLCSPPLEDGRSLVSITHS